MIQHIVVRAGLLLAILGGAVVARSGEQSDAHDLSLPCVDPQILHLCSSSSIRASGGFNDEETGAPITRFIYNNSHQFRMTCKDACGNEYVVEPKYWKSENYEGSRALHRLSLTDPLKNEYLKIKSAGVRLKNADAYEQAADAKRQLDEAEKKCEKGDHPLSRFFGDMYTMLNVVAKSEPSARKEEYHYLLGSLFRMTQQLHGRDYGSISDADLQTLIRLSEVLPDRFPKDQRPAKRSVGSLAEGHFLITNDGHRIPISISLATAKEATALLEKARDLDRTYRSRKSKFEDKEYDKDQKKACLPPDWMDLDLAEAKRVLHGAKSVFRESVAPFEELMNSIFEENRPILPSPGVRHVVLGNKSPQTRMRLDQEPSACGKENDTGVFEEFAETKDDSSSKNVSPNLGPFEAFALFPVPSGDVALYIKTHKQGPQLSAVVWSPHAAPLSTQLSSQQTKEIIRVLEDTYVEYKCDPEKCRYVSLDGDLSLLMKARGAGLKAVSEQTILEDVRFLQHLNCDPSQSLSIVSP